MMALIYSTMLASLFLGWFNYYRSAITIFVITLILAVGWFLFHVYDPHHGFRMPWIQTHFLQSIFHFVKVDLISFPFGDR